jgi:rod shape-determining protein MreC
MAYSPPPLFKQGPSALARLIVFVALALGLLVSDARFKTLETVREVIGIGLYPLQRAALVPRDLALQAAGFFISNNTLRTDNQALRARNLALALQASQAAQLQAENAHLRGLLQLVQHSAIQTVPVEIQYDTRDPFTQKVIIDHGSQQGIQDGAPVVNEEGVIGQVTRIFPLQSEVTLLTDKDQAVPVQVLRTGIRSVIYGTPGGDTLQLRFVPTGADLKPGDLLVTSGLGGVYPAGLPVARVLRVERPADTAFAQVICVPIAPIRGARQLLVLHYQNTMLPRPADEPPSSASAKKARAAKSAAKNAAPTAANNPAVLTHKDAPTEPAARSHARRGHPRAAHPAAHSATPPAAPPPAQEPRP